MTSAGPPVEPLPPLAAARDALPRAGFFARLWKGLRSLRFALVLMGLIVLASIVGTLVKQEPLPNVHAAMDRYGRTLGLVVLLLGLNHLYQAGWFIVLLGLFALSTTACVVSRLKWRLRSLGTILVHGSILFIVAGAITRGAAGQHGVAAIAEGEVVDSFLAETNGRVRGESHVLAAGKTALLAGLDVDEDSVRVTDPTGKVVYRRNADYALIPHNNLTEELARLPMGAIPEGATVLVDYRHRRRMAPLGFALRLDDFEIEHYPGTGSALEVQFADGAEPCLVPVEVGKVLQVRDDGTTIEVLQELPHFMKSDERVYSASDEPMNPAVQVRVRGPGGESTRWVFAKFPGFDAHETRPSAVSLAYAYRPPAVKAFISRVTVLDLAGQAVREATIVVNRPLRVRGYTFYQSSYQGKTISVFEVVSDPGTPLVIAGFVLMPLGMVFVFYVNPFVLKKKSKANV